MNMLKEVKKFLQDEEGASAIEYGLIAALIAAVIIVSVTSIGSSLSTKFSTVAASLL
jgi:pilus assembly protein Flp/PilA